MNILNVESKNGIYGIKIGSGILKDELKKHLSASPIKKVFIITDKNVEGLYRDKINEMSRMFESAHVYVIRPGEDSKNPTELIKIWEAMASEGMTRKDAVIAFGGGVVGDLAGFAAATYLRGIRFIQLPTTLLSQVDSSVGGKVAVDLKAGKNLAGSFYSPEIVIIDAELLKTLTKRTFSDGIGEVIKYGYISKPSILDDVKALKTSMNVRLEAFVDEIDECAIISKETLDIIQKIIFDCCSIKADIVESDETERGLRAILNFGHTIGHGIEAKGEFTHFTHGEAISIGMIHALKFGEKIGITKKGHVEPLYELLDMWNLPSSCSYAPMDLKKFISNDKKADDSGINFIFIEEPGKVIIKNVSLESILKYLSE